MINVIGDGEHAKVVRDVIYSSPLLVQATGCHIAFVGKPGTTHRRKAIEALIDPAATVIHPSAIISRGALIGKGCFIGPLAVINVGARIGDHCIINTGAIVEHDCELGTGVNMAPRSVLGGGVKIGPWATICLGACVRDHITIGESAIVGMGAVVVKDVPPNVTVKGVPACCS